MKMKTIDSLIPAALLTALAGLSAAPAEAQVQAFDGKETRQVSRVFYYTTTDNDFRPEGQFSIDYGPAKWQKAYDDQGRFDEESIGHRWRFGSGVWTTLETNVELAFGSVKVAPGQYYCVLERTKDDKARLLLLDPAEVRKKKLDASQADATKGGIAIDLDWSKKEKDKVEDLEVSLATADDDKTDVTFTVRWGTHKLSCKIRAKVS